MMKGDDLRNGQPHSALISERGLAGALYVRERDQDHGFELKIGTSGSHQSTHATGDFAALRS